MTDGDQDLRKRFSELRREEEDRTPGFEALSRLAHDRGSSWPKNRLLVFAACLAACIFAVLGWRQLVVERLRQRPAEPTVSITEWKAPTEFLLDTPGGELLRTVPAFGADFRLGIAPEPERKQRKHTEKVLP